VTPKFGAYDLSGVGAEITEHPRHRSDDRSVGQRPTQPVIPQSGRDDPGVIGPKAGRFVAEQHPEQQVIDDDDRSGHARSGSSALARAASAA
jgi:hypothetical protein